MKALRRLPGMSSWYRRFIQNYATIESPSTKLLHKKQEWIWEEDQELAFEQITTCLTKTSVLTCQNFEVPFEIGTDASNTGLGAVLTQTINEVECVISVIWAIQKFRAYLTGYYFRGYH